MRRGAGLQARSCSGPPAGRQQHPPPLCCGTFTARAFRSFTHYKDKSAFQVVGFFLWGLGFFVVVVPPLPSQVDSEVPSPWACRPCGTRGADRLARLQRRPPPSPGNKPRQNMARGKARGRVTRRRKSRAGPAGKPGRAQEQHTERGQRAAAAFQVPSKRAWGRRECGFRLRISNSEPLLVSPTAECRRSPKVAWRGLSPAPPAAGKSLSRAILSRGGR